MRKITVTLKIETDVDLWVDNPDDPEEGCGWQIVRAERSPMQWALGPASLCENLGEDDFQAIDDAANAAEDLSQ